MTEVIRVGEGHLVINIIDNNQDTLVLVLPGGGYQLLSNRESGPVATKFNMLGYNTAVLYYTCKPMVPLEQATEAVRILSKYHKNIFVVGFSAGGHLAGYLGTNDYKGNLRGMILCYPVISLYKHTEEGTATSLLGPLDNKENRIKYSIEERVNKDTVPCFIWTTKDDDLVPYENTLMMIDSLKNNHIYVDYQIFDHGVHGLALADETSVVAGNKEYLQPEVAKWPLMADKFIRKVKESLAS